MLVATPLRTPTMNETLVPQVGQVGRRGAPEAAHPAKPRAETHTQQRGHQHGHQDAGGARQRSTPSIQALAGVRVVASLLGQSHKQKKKKQHALCSCAQTQVEHMGCPPCMTQGADHTHSSTPEPGMGGTAERRTLGHEWRGTNTGRAMCHRRYTRRRQGRQDSRRCKHTEHRTQLPSKP